MVRYDVWSLLLDCCIEESLEHGPGKLCYDCMGNDTSLTQTSTMDAEKFTRIGNQHEGDSGSVNPTSASSTRQDRYGLVMTLQSTAFGSAWLVHRWKTRSKARRNVRRKRTRIESSRYTQTRPHAWLFFLYHSISVSVTFARRTHDLNSDSHWGVIGMKTWITEHPMWWS